jgi:hypothetical protein
MMMTNTRARAARLIKSQLDENWTSVEKSKVRATSYDAMSYHGILNYSLKEVS